VCACGFSPVSAASYADHSPLSLGQQGQSSPLHPDDAPLCHRCSSCRTPYQDRQITLPEAYIVSAFHCSNCGTWYSSTYHAIFTRVLQRVQALGERELALRRLHAGADLGNAGLTGAEFVRCKRTPTRSVEDYVYASISANQVCALLR
jgi:hypothetical protein